MSFGIFVCNERNVKTKALFWILLVAVLAAACSHQPRRKVHRKPPKPGKDIPCPIKDC